MIMRTFNTINTILLLVIDIYIYICFFFRISPRREAPAAQLAAPAAANAADAQGGGPETRPGVEQQSSGRGAATSFEGSEVFGGCVDEGEEDSGKRLGRDVSEKWLD